MFKLGANLSCQNGSDFMEYVTLKLNPPLNYPFIPHFHMHI